ncbi:transcriptional repressor CTCFL-like [Galleria mellonella]|uniref:Transcriptional repressor CTCFL-like n=1 Tax=Galleria mellonella TaxID=7137 RepID=A0A6J1X4G0_GALME|nr:transcriptional repressor CTCFL-like [Galleria mellonella]
MANDNKTEICRVCLKTDLVKENKFLSLFEKLKDATISENINTIADVSITHGDRLPTKICPECLLELETALNFKHKCETSNNILRNTSFDKFTDFLLEEYNVNHVKKEESELVQKESDNDFYLNINDYLDTNTEDESIGDDLPDQCPVRKSRAIDLKVVCNECGDSFKSKCKLRVHWKKVHLPQILLCPVCKRTFKTYKAFNRHQKIRVKTCLSTDNMRVEGIGKSRIFHCKCCDYSSRRVKDMQSHIVTHNGERPFPCSLCDRTFTQQSSVQAHQESAHQIYFIETTCEICGKFIRGRNAVYKHMRRHKDEGYQCDICKKILKTKCTLRSHLVRHTGVKSYTCEKCASTFFTIAELGNHKRFTHNKDRFLYKCDICEYKSTRSEVLRRHKSKHTLVNVSCTLCGKFFADAQKLSLHQKRHYAERKYSCPHCNTKFLRKDYLQRHLRSKHMCALVSTKPQPFKEENLSSTVCEPIIEISTSSII